MQERPAPTDRTVAALRGTGVAAMLLAFWCAPAFADLGAADSVNTVRTTSDAATDLEFAAPSVLMVPRVETILREIFDESVPEDHEAAAATPISSPHAAPLAELTAPDLLDKSRSIDDAEIRDDERGVNGVNTRVPGVSEDDLARYRRQMFRTDI